MLNRIKNLFGQSADDTTGGSGNNARPAEGDQSVALAAAVLMVEAAVLEDSFAAEERSAIETALRDRFSLTPDEIAALIDEASKIQDDANHLLRFTRNLKDAYAPEDRVVIMDMLWDVVLADGVLGAHEDQLLRRVAGLLYISDRDRGEARARAMARRDGKA